MHMTCHPHIASPSPIGNRAQAETVLENITGLIRDREELIAQRDKEIAAVHQKYHLELASLNSFIAQETGWIEAWARANPQHFDQARQLKSSGAVIGFKSIPASIDRFSRSWTWTKIAAALSTLPWGKKYLRIPTEVMVDKATILADLSKLSIEDLHAVGIKVIQGDRFYVQPLSKKPSENIP